MSQAITPTVISPVPAKEYRNVCRPDHAELDLLVKESAHPIIVKGKFGPSAYGVEPHLLTEKFKGHDVYGWRSEDKSRHPFLTRPYMIIGAETDKQLYYTAVRKVTTRSSDQIASYWEPTDQKIYAIARERLFSSISQLLIHDTTKPYEQEELYAIGYEYYTGEYRDWNKAFEHFQQAVKVGSSEALLHMGDMCLYGWKDHPANVTEALSYLQQAADLKNITAQFRL